MDTAVLTLAPRTNPARGAPPHRLSVLLVRRLGDAAGPQWALPGSFLHQGERLADAVTRSLLEKAGVTGGHPAQLAVFDDPDRPRMGAVRRHLAVIPYAALENVLLADADRVRLAPVSRPGPLPYAHSAIVVEAKKELRRRNADRPDPARLRGPGFTVSELQDVHEAIAGLSLQKGTCRRAMEPHRRGTGTLSTGNGGRPAQRSVAPVRRGPARLDPSLAGLTSCWPSNGVIAPEPVI